MKSGLDATPLFLQVDMLRIQIDINNNVALRYILLNELKDRFCTLFSVIVIVIVIMISAMFTFWFCPKLQDKHCRDRYDYDYDYARKTRYKTPPLKTFYWAGCWKGKPGRMCDSVH